MTLTRLACLVLIGSWFVPGAAGPAQAQTGRSYTAQPRTAGDQVTIVAYGKDESDGSDVGWNAQYPTPSFDDDPARRGKPNAQWQGAYSWQGSNLCLSIKNLEAPWPPAHTLAVGYTVTLNGGTFEDGTTSKTFVLYRYSGVPAQQDITQCVPARMSGGAAQPQMLIFNWIGQDADFVGEWGNGKPDGRKDGHFQLSLNAGTGVEVKSIAVYSADAGGTPVGGQVWHSAAANYWMLGVFQNGRQMNPSHVPTLGAFTGPVTLDLYGNDSGWFKPGNWFLVDVTLGTGVTIKKTVQLGAAAPTGRSYTAQPRTGSTAAITWADTPKELRGRNGQQFTYVCPPNGAPARVWGTDLYTDDSSICVAAVHAGRITPIAGGTVTIEIRPGQSSYMGTGRNGVLSEGYGAWHGSFAVAGAAPATGSPPPPSATTPAMMSATWTTQANQWSGQNGRRETLTCPPGGPTTGRLWGTDLYTDDSSICLAAVHAGVLTAAAGGTVTIEIRPGQSGYTGSARNGVTSQAYGAWSGSFAVVGATP